MHNMTRHGARRCVDNADPDGVDMKFISDILPLRTWTPKQLTVATPSSSRIDTQEENCICDSFTAEFKMAADRLLRSEFDGYKTNDSHNTPHPKPFYQCQGLDG